MESEQSLDDDARQHAIGGVVIEAAYLERLLRAVFTALVASKYAAVPAATFGVGALIGQCEVLADAHGDVSEEHKAELRAALAACTEATGRRNRVVHDAWARRPGDRAVTLRARPGSDSITVTAWTTDELHQLADDLGAAADNLSAATRAALGEDCLLLADQLRQELGHDIGSDAGRTVPVA